jgi:ABC-2 type transport system permease protein
MRLSWSTVRVVAVRDFLAVVRRKAYLFTAIGLPAYFAAVTYFTAAPQVQGRLRSLRELRTIGVVDSSGTFAAADRSVTVNVDLDINPFGGTPQSQSFKTDIRVFPDQAAADSALRRSEIGQLLVIPEDYVQSGRLRRYAKGGGLFSGTTRPVNEWLIRGLLGQGIPHERVERIVRPMRGMQDYKLDPRTGQYVLNDDKRELVDFLLPFGMAMLLGLAIVTGGQYLLQGLSEEKESRILESLLVAVSPDELLWGKMIGLGAAGLMLVLFWAGVGGTMAAPAFAILKPDPLLFVAGVFYFFFGYVLYASVLMGVGAVANTLREAQQMSWAFTFINFVPFIMLTSIMGQPNAPLAVGLSIFPLTAPTTMMLRMAQPSAGVPAWQVAASLLLLAGTSWLVLRGAARVFRIGLLMYGKTPNLPEILRWVRQG